MTIRKAAPEVFEVLYPILQEIISAGETYAYPRDMTKEETPPSLDALSKPNQCGRA